MKEAIVVGAIVLVTGATAFMLCREIAWTGFTERVPVCQEDEVLVGIGDFDKGRWQQYRCGPALDDFTS